MTDWEVTFSEYNKTTEMWWTGLRPWPFREIPYTKYLSLPYGIRVGAIVTEFGDSDYRPKKFEMEALVCTLAVKKGSAYALEEEINKMLSGYRSYGYVISGFNVTPAYGVVPDDAQHHTYYLITQATQKPVAKKQETTTVVADVKPLVL